MRLSDLSRSAVCKALKAGSLRLRIGRFNLKLDSDVSEFAEAFIKLYGEYPITIGQGVYDYDLSVRHASWLRRYVRRSVSFGLSGDHPFMPMAPDHAHALFEWGLNWTLGCEAHNYLILHSAVVEFHQRGVLLSAVSGSGKSTLAAELSLQGWRLLSDELALVDKGLNLVPCPRPVSLKNQSIEIIRQRYPDADFGPKAQDTHKGTITHLVALNDSVAAATVIATPRLIVIPKWTAGAPLKLEPLGAGQAAMHLIDQSFNYSILGQEGFDRICRLVKQAPAWKLEYSSLDEAVEILEAMVLECD